MCRFCYILFETKSGDCITKLCSIRIQINVIGMYVKITYDERSFVSIERFVSKSKKSSVNLFIAIPFVFGGLYTISTLIHFLGSPQGPDSVLKSAVLH